MKTNVLRIVAIAFVCLYVATYIALSRHGATEAKKFGVDGFYYVTPTDASAFGCHYTLAVLFTPLNVVDRVIGTFELAPGKCPLFELGR